MAAPELLTPAEAAAVLRCSPLSLKDWRVKKRYRELDAALVPVGRKWMYRASVIQELARTGFPASKRRA